MAPVADRLKLSSARLARFVLAFVALAAVAGWSASFVGLHGFALDPMRGYSDTAAWLVPGSFDGAAFACSVLVFRASIHGRSALRGRVLMYAFTAVSGWINWHFQTNSLAQWVGAALPFAAVLVFDVILTDLRAEWEIQHGQQAFRLRVGLLVLRWVVDRAGTWSAFRASLISVPVTELVGMAPGPAWPTETPPTGSRPAPQTVTESQPERRGDLAPVAPITPVSATATGAYAARFSGASLAEPVPAPEAVPVPVPEVAPVPRPVPPETENERTQVIPIIGAKAGTETRTKVAPAPVGRSLVSVPASAGTGAKRERGRGAKHSVAGSAKSGASDAQLADRVRAAGGLTRRQVMSQFRVGAARAARIIALAQEEAS